MIRDKDVLKTFDRWTDDFTSFVQDKGKVTPGKYRAYGHQAPGHLLRDGSCYGGTFGGARAFRRRVHHRLTSGNWG